MHSRLPGIFLLAALLTTAAMPGYAAPTLVLFPLVRAVAQEDGVQSIEVAKVARVVGSREERNSLGSLHLSLETLLGRRKLGRAELVAALRELPELEALEIVGPEWISVVSPTDAAVGNAAIDEAIAALREYIDARWPRRYRNVLIAFRGETRRLPLGRESEWSFDFSQLERLTRRTPVWLVARHGNSSERSVLWFEVEAEEQVWQSYAALDAHSVAAPESFMQAWRRLDEFKPREATVPTRAMRLSVPMQAGEVLTQRHLEAIPDVEYGDDAMVISRVGDVEIRSLATVMKTAFIGDVIPLQSKSSREHFLAKVVDRNLVSIDRSRALAREGISGRQEP